MGKKTFDWLKFHVELEKQVVESQHLAVKNSLHDLNFGQIPREHVAPLAELAWRISEPLLTLKLLNKIIFPENEFEQDATDREKFIYATALANLGAVDEALELFSAIRSENEPELGLRKALAHFRTWNYRAARPLLQEFVQQPGLPPYRHLIGQVNLAAALVTDCQFEVAKNLLSEIEATCEKNNYLLLLGNCFELQSQIYFFQKDYDTALGLLEKSLRLLEKQGGEFHLYAEKWKVICLAYQKRDAPSLEALRAFRQKALQVAHAETVRECDLFESCLTQDENMFRKVILGTPFEFYRQRARALYGRNLSAQGQFHWQLGSNAENQTPFIFRPYDVQAGGESLHQKSLLLALFEALTVDFYRSNHIGLLFQRIYKGEKFNPFSSPTRVLSLIKRLDHWFTEQKVPLRVQMRKSEFALIANENRSVQVLVQRAKSLSKQDGHISRLRELFKGRSFTSKLVAEKLEISKDSAQSLLLQAVQESLLVKRGTGRATTYMWAPRNKKGAAA